MESITEHVFRVEVGDCSVFLIAQTEGLTLIDAGFPNTLQVLEEAIRSLGGGLEDIRDILVTHCHPDHAGGLAEIEKATGAKAWMHPADAALVRAGRAFRPWTCAPGEHNEVFAREVIAKELGTFEPATVEGELEPGEMVSAAGGIKAVWTPGHTVGHLTFLWSGDGGVLFVGDAAKHVEGLEPATIYEDLAQGLDSLRMLGGEDFQTACFAHGAPIVGDAAREFRAVFGDGRQEKAGE
jgi:glyoxylase-like metal-dependent hydrolase (beta-lactamase superfamily II)